MKPIIVGTDFSEGSYLALELAVDVANRMQTGIVLVWAKREKKLFSNDQLDVMTNLANEKLRELCAKFRPAMRYGEISSMIENGRVSTVISNLVKRLEAPLVVVGTNGASGFEKYWMGSQAVRIVQDSPCPVLTIRQGYDFHKKLERIVVPIRVNANSRQKVAPATGVARIFGSSLHILGLYDMKDQETSLRTFVQQSEEYAQRHGVEAVSVVRPYSNYCDTLLEYADEISADMLVVNTEQDRIISQMFLGTNAQQVVNRSQIPVLSIHPADFINVASRV
ncbi:MAG: universal stress protein [Bacteroidales bacterium]|nr:universal stress protein [Bacteroidales bacterium]MBR1799866.1 universal stress protein [Bacteroidales bacterium]